MPSHERPGPRISPPGFTSLQPPVLLVDQPSSVKFRPASSREADLVERRVHSVHAPGAVLVDGAACVAECPGFARRDDDLGLLLTPAR